jgi:histidyl-tRNA synthetase
MRSDEPQRQGPDALRGQAGAAYSLVLGEQELSEGKAVLKRMDGGPSLPIALDDGFAAHFARDCPGTPDALTSGVGS